MPEINYIKHLNTFFQNLSQDKRLNATHVSMYLALFYQWNNTRFSDEFYINRNEIMSLSKIGSKGTYHKCLKDLHQWKYLEYLPSYNPQKGSKIKMSKFGTSSGQVPVQVSIKSGTGTGQVSGPYINRYKHSKHINFYKLCQAEKKKEILSFFKKENWSKIEAEKFFNHYQGIGWKLGGKIKIVDWKATAHNWILKAAEIQAEKTKDSLRVQTNIKSFSRGSDNLHVDKNKNYDEPL